MTSLPPSGQLAARAQQLCFAVSQVDILDLLAAILEFFQAPVPLRAQA